VTSIVVEVNPCQPQQEKENSKNFVSEHLQKKKLWAKVKWKRNKKATLQKQNQFASGQPCNGCNAQIETKTKTKNNNSQPLGLPHAGGYGNCVYLMFFVEISCVQLVCS